jgi:hypothetical protein
VEFLTSKEHFDTKINHIYEHNQSGDFLSTVKSDNFLFSLSKYGLKNKENKVLDKN